MSESSPRWNSELPLGLSVEDDPRAYGRPYMICNSEGEAVGRIWTEDVETFPLKDGYRLFAVEDEA